MRWDSKKHPRHKENGRFRDKAGSDATAYARRISAKIAAARGEKNDDEPTAAEKRAQEHLKAGTRMRPGAKKAPAKKAPAKKAPARKASDDAPTAAEKRAMARLASGKRQTSVHEGASGEESRISPKATKNRVDEAKDIVLGMRGASKAEIDAKLHPRLEHVSTARLRAMIEHLNGERGLYNQVVANAIERLIDKR